MALLHRYKTALTPVGEFYISRHNQLMFLSNFLREVRSSFCQFVKSEYLFCGFFPLTVAWTCWDILNVVMGRNVPEKRNMFTAWNKPKNQICFHDWNNKLSLKDKQLTLFCSAALMDQTMRPLIEDIMLKCILPQQTHFLNQLSFSRPNTTSMFCQSE